MVALVLSAPLSAAARARCGTRSRPISTRCGASASGPTTPTRRWCWCPAQRCRSARRRRCSPRTGSHAGASCCVHPGSRWLFKCWPAAPTAALLDRLAADGWPLVLTGAPDPAEPALVVGDQGGDARAGRRPVRAAHAAGARRADRRGAPVHRRRFGADAHGRGDGHAGGRAVRTERRARMGAVAGAAPRRRVDRASLPSLRQQRLRRQQPFRLPADASRARRSPRRWPNCSAATADRRAAMRLGIVRQRYTPFGGAERFVERAIDALLERGVARQRLHAQVAAGARRTDRAGHLQSVLRRQPVARRELRCRRARGAGARSSGHRAVARAHRRLRHLPRRRRRAPRVARRADPRAGGRLERARIAANPYHRYVLDAEARMFASPALKAVICISQMVKDDVRRHFAVPDDRLHVIYNAVDPREFGPGVRSGARGDARPARPRRRPRRVPARRLGLCAQGRADGDPRACAAAGHRAARRRRRDKASGALRDARASRRRARSRRVRRTAAGPAAVPGRRRCVRAADALRSAVQRGAGGPRLRIAGRDQPPLRRGRTRRRAWRGVGLRRARRRGAGRAHGGAARLGRRARRIPNARSRRSLR